MFRSVFSLALMLAIGVIASQCTDAHAQDVDYAAIGFDAAFTPDFTTFTGDYEGDGIGNLLGAQTIEGTIAFTGIQDFANGIFFEGVFSGTQTVTAANGDTLEMTLSGTVLLTFTDATFTAVEGEWYPSFKITGGSGRFKNAAGCLEGVAINPPFNPTSQVWPFDWSIEGEIDLGKR